MGDNAAPRTPAKASTTTNASSAALRPSLVLPRDFVAATAGSPSLTSRTSADPGLRGETELQPWSYRQASYAEQEALRRAKREQREAKARRASEVWKKFWT